MTIGDDKELFEAAMSDTPAEQPAPEPAPEPQSETDGQPRDEHGRFAPKQEAAPAEPEPAQPAPAPEPAVREDHRIPLAEHLSVRERAQRAEQERDQERQGRADLERRLQAMERQLAEARQPPKETPDVWADPAGFVKAQLAPVTSQQEAIVERISRAYAVDKFGAEAVNTAMAELERQMMTNPQARFEHQRIMASDLPYVELVHWHKRQAALKEVGDDPAAYKQRIIEEALKDPEVVKRVIESAREQAQQPPPGQPRSTAIDLPPSLSKQPGTAAEVTPTAKTDAEIFKEMFPR